MAVNYASQGDSDGWVFGQAATNKVGFFGATPVVRQTAGTDAPAVDPTVSGSTILQSLQSIAIGAASLANANALALANLGLTA